MCVSTVMLYSCAAISRIPPVSHRVWNMACGGLGVRVLVQFCCLPEQIGLIIARLHPTVLPLQFRQHATHINKTALGQAKLNRFLSMSHAKVWHDFINSSANQSISWKARLNTRVYPLLRSLFDGLLYINNAHAIELKCWMMFEG